MFGKIIQIISSLFKLKMNMQISFNLTDRTDHSDLITLPSLISSGIKVVGWGGASILAIRPSVKKKKTIHWNKEKKNPEYKISLNLSMCTDSSTDNKTKIPKVTKYKYIFFLSGGGGRRGGGGGGGEGG